MKKICSLYCLVFGSFILLVLASCNRQPIETELYKEFHKGKVGVTASLLGNPTEILEQTPLSITLKLSNQGAYTAEGLGVLSIEEDYMCIADKTTNNCLPKELKEQAKVHPFILNGRNRYMPSGESDLYEFPLRTKSIEAVSEKHKSHITATVCYGYQTEFIGEACLEPGKYALKKATPVCEMKNLEATDQGAPIAVTGVEVNLLPEGDIVKPMFTFTVENKGRGVAIYPVEKINELCSSSQVQFKETNSIVLQELKLSNGLFYIFGRDDINTMACEPNPMRLKDGKDRIRCYQKSQRDYRSAIQNTQPAFTVQLSAVFRYGYTESIGQDITIYKPGIK